MRTPNVLLPLILACRPQAPTVPPATTAGTSDTEPGSVPGETNTSPCFEQDVVPLFGRSCGSGDNGCHSAVAYAADPQNDCYGWLSLEDRPLGSKDPVSGAPTGCPDRDLYARLTELASWQCYVNGTALNGNQSLTIPYVVSGDPDGSYLWWKVDPGSPLCDLANGPSQRMPTAVELASPDLELLDRWMRDGAPRCDASTGNGPSCEITSPLSRSGLDFREPFAFRAVATGTVTWTVGTTVLGAGTSLDATLPASGWNVVTCTATDAAGNQATDMVEVRAISPIVEIWHPGDGEVRDIDNGPFPFQGYAEDLEDGVITDLLEWFDEGVWFAGGTSFSYLPEPAGYHTIEASVKDSEDQVGWTAITVEMTR